jgi:hypothetical protein
VNRRTSDAQLVTYGNTRNLGRLYGYNRFIGGQDTIIGGMHTSLPVDTWASPTNSDVLGSHLDVYMGTSNTWRATNRLLNRLNSIYSPSITTRPFKHFKWMDAYSGAGLVVRPRLGDFGPIDSLSYLNAFIKLTSTQSVKRWTRTTSGGFIDSVDGSGHPAFDATTKRFVEVGMFIDSSTPSAINYAALIVNTRMWPSLTDPADTLFYNSGTDSLKDHCHSTLGDIDSRKIFLTIDTSKLALSVRSPYYVVRDLEHPDTTWLVKCDSQFAVYIKPGDAKFLYFEKGISIKASPTASMGATEFCYNNGHRVAERMNGTRDVIAYTRNNHLYVSYSGRGKTWSDYASHSDGDNLLSGVEYALDTTHFCARPSIMVAPNDTAVAITYWIMDTIDIHVSPIPVVAAAYQAHPDSVWKTAIDLNTLFGDRLPQNDEVTPVIAPVSDTSWVIAAAYNPLGFFPSQIKGATFVTPKGLPPYFTSSDMMLIALPDSGVKVYFPTVSSRPVVDADYPYRLAYQYKEQIYFARFQYQGTSTLHHDKIFQVSQPLVGCANVHPCIASNGTQYFYPASPPLTGLFGPLFFDDNVIWEARDHQTAPLNWVPAIRHRFQTNPGNGQWGGIDVWVKEGTIIPSHWPSISAQYFKYTVVNPYILWATNKPFTDWIRAAWQANYDSSAIRVASWIPGTWVTSTLSESGNYPSLALPTDSASHMTGSTMVPRSIAFRSHTGSGGMYDARVTNGWLAWVARVHNEPNLWILRYTTDCIRLVQSVKLRDGVIGTSPARPIEWQATDKGRGGQMDDDWPKVSRAPNELHSYIFKIAPSETIALTRTMDSLDLTGLRDSLKSSSDYVRCVISLRKWQDSSYLGTVDSMFISQSVNLSPGHGLNPTTATFTLPSVLTADSAFLMVELTRGDTLNGLHRVLIEAVDDTTYTGSLKRTSAEAEKPSSKLSVTIHPNPFNPTTWLEVTGSPSLHTKLDLMDVLGRPVQTLYDSDMPESGALHIVLNASQLASGVYFVRAISGNYLVTTRIELIK